MVRGLEGELKGDVGMDFVKAHASVKFSNNKKIN